MIGQIETDDHKKESRDESDEDYEDSTMEDLSDEGTFSIKELRKTLMSDKAAVAAKKKVVNIADGDVTPKSGPIEQVLLAGPYSRWEAQRGTVSEVDGEESGKTHYTCWMIVVFCNSGPDAKDVEAIHRGPAHGNQVVTIEKWRLPDVLRGPMATVTANQLFNPDTVTDPDEKAHIKGAANALKETIHHLQKITNDKMRVDVHFPKPVLVDIRRLPYFEIEYIMENAQECFSCGEIALMTSVPMQVFEVREVDNKTTEVESRQGRRVRATYRK